MTRAEKKRQLVADFAMELRAQGQQVHVSKLADRLNANGLTVKGEPYSGTPRSICQVVQHTVLRLMKKGGPGAAEKIKAIQDAFYPRPWLKKKKKEVGK